VTLTEEGMAALRRAYPVHLRSLRTRVLDHVDRSALPCFAQAVIAIAESFEWRRARYIVIPTSRCHGMTITG
jgi:hypothetical protein